MAGYLPHHRKKKERLAKVERQLLSLIERGAPREKLLEAALEVRDGRIRVLRAKQNQNPETNARLEAIFLKDRERIRVLKSRTAESVLAEYLPNESPES